MRIRVCYEESLRLVVEGRELDAFLKSSLWKMRLPKAKRHFQRVDGNAIVLDDTLSRRDRASIVNSLDAAEKAGFEVVIDPSFADHAEREKAQLDEHASVGLAIKSHAAEVLPLFVEYASALSGLMVRPLRERQLWDSFFMCSMGKSANFSVPGSGKTASALGVFAYLQSLGRVNRILVVCPKNAFGSWRSEWASCFGGAPKCRALCFHDESFACRTATEKRRELMLNIGRYNLILMNYESLANYEDLLRGIASEKTLLVFDEVHKIKRVGGMRAESALEIAAEAQYVIALTGTPIPNSYCDIYNLLHVLYPDDYDDFFGFSLRTLSRPQPRDVEQINEAINPFFCRTDKKSLGVPDALPDTVIRNKASCAENELFLRIKEIYKRDAFALIIRTLQMESDPEMVFNALETRDLDEFFNERPLPDVLSEPLPTDAASLVGQCRPTAKTKECLQLANRLLEEGKSLIIWCYFRQSMTNLSRGLGELGWDSIVINGSTSQIEREVYLDDFKRGKTRLLITNPHTLAESVSLHKACHDAIYFEYSYNLVHLLQSKDRIHRLGLEAGQYTQYYYLQTRYSTDDGEWSLDEKIYERLLEKEQTMLDAIDKGVLEPGVAEEDDIRLVFEGLFDPEEIAKMRK